LNAENINYVDKEHNPANVPEVRSIKDFWEYLKFLVYANGWQAENLKKLMTRIKYCLNEMDQTVVHRLSTTVKRRIDHVRRYGVIESY